MRNPVLRTVFCAAVVASFVIASDLPYAGKWKVNLAKSDFGQTTVTYESMSGGEMKVTIDGLSYTFKADGKIIRLPGARCRPGNPLTRTLGRAPIRPTAR